MALGKGNDLEGGLFLYLVRSFPFSKKNSPERKSVLTTHIFLMFLDPFSPGNGWRTIS